MVRPKTIRPPVDTQLLECHFSSMTPVLKSKLPETGTTIFTVMSQLAQNHGAINLSQGFPDFDAPEALLDRVQFHLTNKKNQYAPMTGIPELREQVANKTSKLYSRSLDTDLEITITAGATEALFCAIQTVVKAGDEVIVFDPAYDSYEPAVTLAGGVTRHIPLDPEDFSVDWTVVADTVSSKTTLIILNSPHNPTGAVLSRGDLDSLADIVRNNDIFILSDEVYEHIIFDKQQHHSMLTHNELWPRSFVVSSFGKTYHATGWKVGYCVAPSLLSAEFRKIHQYNCFCVVSPIQYALADYLQSDPAHYQTLGQFYQDKRNYFLEGIKKSRFAYTPSAGTYFQLLEYQNITKEKDTDFANRLTQDYGVASIPISVFYDKAPDTRYLRFCFAKTHETLDAAAKILCQI